MSAPGTTKCLFHSEKCTNRPVGRIEHGGNFVAYVDHEGVGSPGASRPAQSASPLSRSWMNLHVRLLQRCRIAFIAAVFVAIGGYASGDGGPLIGGPLPKTLFPADNWWNVEIRNAPVDSRSNAFIEAIAARVRHGLHPDFGGRASWFGTDIYGLPYVTVGADQKKKAVSFEYASESDGVDHATGRSLPFYPIPDEAATSPHWIEGGAPGDVDGRQSNDRHLLIVDRDRGHLYELYNVYFDGREWHAGSGAFFDLHQNARRPEGWTSADAGGLAILPGLIRYDEVYGSDEIRHALRVTLRGTNGFVYPASHAAGRMPGALPLGARLRLRSAKDLSGFPPPIQKIFRAMQNYGLIVADNGSDLFVSGTFDSRWDNHVLNPAFGALTISDFEVVTLGFDASGLNKKSGPTLN